MNILEVSHGFACAAAESRIPSSVADISVAVEPGYGFQGFWKYKRWARMLKLTPLKSSRSQPKYCVGGRSNRTLDNKVGNTVGLPSLSEVMPEATSVIHKHKQKQKQNAKKKKNQIPVYLEF